MKALQLQLFHRAETTLRSLPDPIRRLGLRILGGTEKKTARPSSGPKRYMSDPLLREIWLEVRQEYFPHRKDLDEYAVSWSKRNQKRTLASCNIELKKINVARELNHPTHHQWLSPLLYHEMCHAYLEHNVSRHRGKFAWHGREFRSLEALHPCMNLFDSWVKSGGWATAVRSHRSRTAHAKRKESVVNVRR